MVGSTGQGHPVRSLDPRQSLQQAPQSWNREKKESRKTCPLPCGFGVRRWSYSNFLAVCTCVNTSVWIYSCTDKNAALRLLYSWVLLGALGMRQRPLSGYESSCEDLNFAGSLCIKFSPKLSMQYEPEPQRGTFLVAYVGI